MEFPCADIIKDLEQNSFTTITKYNDIKETQCDLIYGDVYNYTLDFIKTELFKFNKEFNFNLKGDLVCKIKKTISNSSNNIIPQEVLNEYNHIIDLEKDQEEYNDNYDLDEYDEELEPDYDFIYDDNYDINFYECNDFYDKIINQLIDEIKSFLISKEYDVTVDNKVIKVGW